MASSEVELADYARVGALLGKLAASCFSYELSGNPHRVCHESVPDYIADPWADGVGDDWWELFELVVYEDNSVGRVSFMGPTAHAVLQRWAKHAGVTCD